jgi:photosystem II stability/assembly factor-like uncharacterized protein
VGALSIRPDIPTTIYAGTWGGVFRSTDGGESWNAVNSGLTSLIVPALSIRPDTPTTIYAGTYGGGVFRSTDGGESWTAVNSGLTNLDVNALSIRPDTPTTIYAGTYGGGVFRSTDGGESWNAVNSGLTNLDVLALAIRPDTPTTIYAGTYSGDVFRSTDGGDTWTAINNGLTSFYVNALSIRPDTPTTIYAGTYGGVFRSTDGGNSWTAINTGLTNLGVCALAMRPDTPILYAGTYGSSVFSFTETVNAGTVTLDTPGPPTWTYTLTWNSGTVNEWFYRGAGITGASVTGSAQDAGWTVLKQTDTEVIFLAGTPLTGPGSLSGFQISGSQGGMGTWIAHSNSGTVEGALPVELSKFTASSDGSKVTLKWRTESETNNLGFNVYRSEEVSPPPSLPRQGGGNVKGGNYVKVNATLIKGAGTDATPHEYQFVDESVVVGATYYYYLEDVDFAGNTHKSSIITVFVGRTKSATMSLRPVQFRLLPNFPNPFNPETWIPFELPSDAEVSVVISDARGRLVRRMELGQKEAGYYVTRASAIYWDGRSNTGENVASGVYFYTLQAGQFIATRKMVIVK